MYKSNLELYLQLEQQMIALDNQGTPEAEAGAGAKAKAKADIIRDKMDPIWYSLSNEECTFLNQRNIK